MVFGSCTKRSGTPDDETNSEPKEEPTIASVKIGEALDAIKISPAYHVLVTEETGTLKSAGDNPFEYRSYSIGLDVIGGIYDFQPDAYRYHIPASFFLNFSKTGESENLVIRMPYNKLFFWKNPHGSSLSDTIPGNNFVITTDDYLNAREDWYNHEYLLHSELGLDNEAAGELQIHEYSGSTGGSGYSAMLDFGNTYSASISRLMGDTCTREYLLMKDEEDLFRERVMFIREDDSFDFEFVYILTLGNIEIRRGSDIQGIEVWYRGELQNDIQIDFVKEGSGNSVFGKRDIQLTFEDGTVFLLSEILGPYIGEMNRIFLSMMKFQRIKTLVDGAAFYIYENSRAQD